MQIETGCLAIIINSKAGNNGICVTVGKFIGEVDRWLGSKRWEIDRTLYGHLGNSANHAEEYQLMRIDNFKVDETLEREVTLERPASDPYDEPF